MEKTSIETKDGSQEKIMRMIIEEVPDARDVFHLYLQLKEHLPIKCFKDLYKVGKEDGMLSFRDLNEHVGIFDGMIPEFIFPIEDEKGLITRLAQFIKLMPSGIGYDFSKPENIKRATTMNFLSKIADSALSNVNKGTSGFGIIAKENN